MTGVPMQLPMLRLRVCEDWADASCGMVGYPGFDLDAACW